MTDYEALLQVVIVDPRYQERLDWGEPRAGHPEGTIRAHIGDLERNLDALRPRLSDADCLKLQILIHTHDTFKADAKEGVAIIDDCSHASLARQFLSALCDDRDLLNMVQYHDEPRALWLQLQSKGQYDQERFTTLLSSIDDWNVFLAFCIIDGCTPGKNREPLSWFLAELDGKVESDITAADIRS